MGGVKAVRPHPTPRERAEAGWAARKRLPLSRHAELAPDGGRPDPVDVLIAQEQDRLPDLIPIRHGRMLASPLAFLRGSAAVMAADLGRAPSSGLVSQLCGDAHLLNFGLFASPERRPGVRHQRLRRDLSRPLRVGHQTAGGQPRGGRAGRTGCGAASAPRSRSPRPGATGPRWHASRPCASWMSGTPGPTSTSYAPG